LYIVFMYTVICLTERSDKTKWCIPVTNALDLAVEKAVAEDSHITKSEFVRDAVRKQLEGMGFRPQIFSRQSEQQCPVNST
jgi:hypothetical protein